MRVNQRLRAVLIHHAVPGQQHRLRFPRPLVRRRDHRNERLQIFDVQGQVVGLHGGRGFQAVLIGRVEELLDPSGAEILFLVLAETRHVIVREIGVVGVKGETGIRIVQLGPLFERDRASPVEVGRRALDRDESKSGPSQRDQARIQEADVSVDIGKDEVLGRCLIEAQRIKKFAPVSRGIDLHEGFARRVAHRDVDRPLPARRIRQVCVDVGKD